MYETSCLLAIRSVFATCQSLMISSTVSTCSTNSLESWSIASDLAVLTAFLIWMAVSAESRLGKTYASTNLAAVYLELGETIDVCLADVVHACESLLKECPPDLLPCANIKVWVLDAEVYPAYKD